MSQPEVQEDPESDPPAEVQPDPSDKADMKIEVDPATGRFVFGAKFSGRTTAVMVAFLVFVTGPIVTVKLLGTSSGAPEWAPYALAFTELFVGLVIVWMLLRPRPQ